MEEEEHEPLQLMLRLDQSQTKTSVLLVVRVAEQQLMTQQEGLDYEFHSKDTLKGTCLND
jgi:hypothetical protein